MGTLSFYILTNNSAKYLSTILSRIAPIADDLVLVDSGSIDETPRIAKKYGARFICHPFKDFASQRIFALEQCRYSWVFSLDSDEIPDEHLARSLSKAKTEDYIYKGTQVDSYAVKRRWLVMGKEVRTYYPVSAPDRPIRLFDKRVISFAKGRSLVHEGPRGINNPGLLDGTVWHHSVDSIQQLYEKMEFYTTLAAKYALIKKKNYRPADVFIRPVAAFFKWYLLKGAYRDGTLGYVMARYAYDYTYKKITKARLLQKAMDS